MSAEEKRFTRVILDLDASSDSSEIIETACCVAEAIKAEVYGLLVEEQSVIDLCSFPFARVLRPGRTEGEALSADSLLDAYVKQATVLRHAISTRASGARLAWGFDTARGHGRAEIRSRVSTTDLVVLQQHAFGESASELIGTARTTAETASGVVILGRLARLSAGPVVIVDDGDEAGEQTAAFGGRLARALDAPVRLIVIADDPAKARHTETRDLALLSGVRTIAVAHIPDRIERLEDAVAVTRPRFVVADLEGAPFRDDQTAARLIRAARAPVILLRARPAGRRSSQDAKSTGTDDVDNQDA